MIEAILSHLNVETLPELLAGLGLRLVLAALIVLAGWLAAKFLVAWTVKALERLNFPDPTVRGAAALVLRWLVILVTSYYVLTTLGVQTTAFLGLLTGSALAIGLAVQGTLSNVASGLMLLILRPLKVGEYIVAASQEGTVQSVGIFYTYIDTIEGYRVAIPNGALFSSSIVNMSRNSMQTSRIRVGIAYEADIEAAQHVIAEAVSACEHVEPIPPVAVLVVDLGESSVDLEVRFQAHRDHIWPASRAARAALKTALDSAGIEIPYPQLKIHGRKEADHG